jgi:hypothetical protein
VDHEEVRLRIHVLWMTIAALALAACGGDPYEVGELTPYISPKLGFRVDYPSNWDVNVDPVNLVGSEPGKVHAVAFASLAANTIFVVYTQDLDSAETLEAYAARQMDNIRSTADDTVFADLAPMQLGGRDALTTRAAVAQNGETLTQRTVLAVSGLRGYAVSLIAPADSPLNATLDEMLASFGFQP